MYTVDEDKRVTLRNGFVSPSAILDFIHSPLYVVYNFRLQIDLKVRRYNANTNKLFPYWSRG